MGTSWSPAPRPSCCAGRSSSSPTGSNSFLSDIHCRDHEVHARMGLRSGRRHRRPGHRGPLQRRRLWPVSPLQRRRGQSDHTADRRALPTARLPGRTEDGLSQPRHPRPYPRRRPSDRGGRGRGANRESGPCAGAGFDSPPPAELSSRCGLPADLGGRGRIRKAVLHGLSGQGPRPRRRGGISRGAGTPAQGRHPPWARPQHLCRG